MFSFSPGTGSYYSVSKQVVVRASIIYFGGRREDCFLSYCLAKTIEIAFLQALLRHNNSIKTTRLPNQSFNTGNFIWEDIRCLLPDETKPYKKGQFQRKRTINWPVPVKQPFELFCYGHCAMNLMKKALNLSGD